MALHGWTPRHAVLIHVDDLDGAGGRVVVLLVVLLAHLVEYDQHDCRHEGDGHEASDDDLGGLHHLIQPVEGALPPQLRHRNGVGLLRGPGGEWCPHGGGRGGGGGYRLPAGRGGGTHLQLHSGLALIMRWLYGLHCDRGEVAEAAVCGRHVERGRRRGVARRVAHHAGVSARVLHGDVGEIESAVVQDGDADLVGSVGHDGAVGCDPADGGQRAGPAFQFRHAPLRHVQVCWGLHDHGRIAMKIVLVKLSNIAPLVAGG